MAIESILGQTFKDFELILVNNNSQDSSEKIAKSHQTQDPRIVLVNETKQGVVFASNYGFQMSRAPLIARMDADDQMFPHRLERQARFLETHSNVDVIGGQVEYQGNDENIGFRHYVDWSNGLVTAEDLQLNRFVELPVVNPTIMFRKALFNRYGAYIDGNHPEDYEMILRWMYQGVNIEKLAEPVLRWRDHSERLTRTDPRYSETAFFVLKAKYLARWLKQTVDYKEIWIWGAGKLSRRRSNLLQEHGIQIKGYIDVKPRQLPIPCIHFREVPEPGQKFIISYVSNRGKREEIKQFLLTKGYVEGVDFLLAA